MPRRPNIADTVDQVAVAVRRDIKYGADWVKLMVTGGVLDLQSDFNVQDLSDEQIAKAVEVAHRAGRHVMAHAEGTEGIKAAVRAGVDSIEHGTMLDDEGAALMAKKGNLARPHPLYLPARCRDRHGVRPGPDQSRQGQGDSESSTAGLHARAQGALENRGRY
jgi:imidazolonepropionase-like amidohydrolase